MGPRIYDEGGIHSNLLIAGSVGLGFGKRDCEMCMSYNLIKQNSIIIQSNPRF